MKNPQPFAVFDIDGTLIRWQMMHAIINQLAREGSLGEGIFDHIRQKRMAWKARTHTESFSAYEKALIHIYLKAITAVKTTEFDHAVDKVFDEYKDQAYVYTRQLIKRLKSEGYYLLTISGSQSEIVERIADYYGFDAAEGCRFERSGTMFTGEFDTPIFDKGAVLRRMISQHRLGTDNSIAIGDSEGDIPLFELSERAIAFNPTRSLLETARVKGWDIVVERKNVIYELQPHDGQYILA